MGGDLGGWRTVPQNLRWGPMHPSSSIFGEVVLLEAWQRTNRLKKNGVKENFFNEKDVFLEEKGVIYVIYKMSDLRYRQKTEING